MIEGRTYDRRAVFAWSMYDFANSAFNTLVVTFIYGTYFTKVIASNVNTGTLLWSRAVAVTAITVALLSPIMGAIADRGGYRKRLLLLMTLLSVLGSVMLYTALPGQTTKALLWFVMANIAFEMGTVFYNAFLPDIAPAEKIGRISGYGWSLGYVGGLAAMSIAFVGFVNPEVPWFGLSLESGQNVRATNLLVALWFAVFSLPIFLWVKEDKFTPSTTLRSTIGAGIKQVMETFHEIRKYKQLVRLLLARMFYNDGLVTIFAFGGIYAAGTFGFSLDEVIIFGIVLNVAAAFGAFVFGFLDDIIGGKKTIQISVVGLALASIIAVFARSRAVFWLAAVLIGILSGPNQAASRSLMARFVPSKKENQFFGFFAFSGKATAFLGPLLMGQLTDIFQTQRAGISIVIPFFVVGSLILTTVNEKEGVKIAGRALEPSKD